MAAWAYFGFGTRILSHARVTIGWLYCTGSGVEREGGVDEGITSSAGTFDPGGLTSGFVSAGENVSSYRGDENGAAEDSGASGAARGVGAGWPVRQHQFRARVAARSFAVQEHAQNAPRGAHDVWRRHHDRRMHRR